MGSEVPLNYYFIKNFTDVMIEIEK